MAESSLGGMFWPNGWFGKWGGKEVVSGRSVSDSHFLEK